MARLFGTDGVRGVANTELTGELAFRLGRAGAYVLTKETKHAPRILVAMDTRISGDMLESALVSGICSVGAHAVVAGVIPTPAVAYLVRKYRLDAGVMISASHNPVEYNGIKFFNNQGYKLSDALEDEIENIIMSHPEILPSPTGIGLGTKEYAEDALDDYIAFLTRTTTEKFDGIKVALDCANGAAYKAAPIAMLDLGASLCIIHNEPDGTNINDKCGSTHMDDLKEMVVKNGADIGFAFDGDADRCLAVDEKGNLIDGVLYQCSQSPENSHLFCPVNYHRTYRLLSVNSPFPCCRCSHIPALCRSTPDQGNHNASAPPSELSGTDSLAPGPLPAHCISDTSVHKFFPETADPLMLLFLFPLIPFYFPAFPKFSF